MSYSSRSKVSSVLSHVALIIIVGAILVSVTLYAPHAPSAYARSKSSLHVSATKGTITRAATVNVAKLPTGSVPPAARAKVAIPYHSPAKATTNSTQLPTSASAVFSGSSKGGLLQNFNGLSSLDNQKVNGFQLEPPDQGLCVGNGFVVELINLVGAVYQPGGGITAGPFGLQAFFAETPGQSGTFISDPRCYFDTSTNTWFATVLAFNQNSSTLGTHMDLAVNSSGDPTTSWTVYRIDTTNQSDPGCPCLPDQPILGIDQYNVYITENEFPFFSFGFNGAQIYAISKSQLVSLSPTVNTAHFGNLTTAGFPTYHLEPAITYGKASAEYLMNSIGPFDNLDNRLGLWAITNQQAVTSGGTPTLLNTTLNSETYVAPSFAPNPNGNVLNPDDDGLLQLQYSNGNLWTSLNTALLISGDSASRDGAAWFEVHPTVSGSQVSGQFVHQGYVALKGSYLLYSAIATSPDKAAVMVFTVTSASLNPSAGYAVLQSGSSSFGSVQIAAKGTTTDNGFTCGGPLSPCRWGDYSAAVVAPGSTNVWVATEYIPPVGASGANWGTRVFEVKA